MTLGIIIGLLLGMVLGMKLGWDLYKKIILNTVTKIRTDKRFINEMKSLMGEVTKENMQDTGWIEERLERVVNIILH